MKNFSRSLIILGTIFGTLVAKVEFIEKGFSYDDVLLVPQKSTVESRKQVSTKTKLTQKYLA